MRKPEFPQSQVYRRLDRYLAPLTLAAYTEYAVVSVHKVRRGVMELVLNSLLGLALVAVVAVLAMGLVSFAAGGEFNRKYANKLMRLRVATQAFAVLILLALLLLRGAASAAVLV